MKSRRPRRRRSSTRSSGRCPEIFKGEGNYWLRLFGSMDSPMRDLQSTMRSVWESMGGKDARLADVVPVQGLAGSVVDQLCWRPARRSIGKWTTAATASRSTNPSTRRRPSRSGWTTPPSPDFRQAGPAIAEPRGSDALGNDGRAGCRRSALVRPCQDQGGRRRRHLRGRAPGRVSG